MSNVTKEHRDDNIRRAELRKMSVRRHDLDYGIPSEVLVQVLGHDHRDGQVLHALDDMTRDGDMAKDVPKVALEDCLSNTQGNIRAHVEEGAAKFLDCDGVHVTAYC
ncbi:hypothetical protein Droror1_Dr00009131 [Drosera rotundifolia]